MFKIGQERCQFTWKRKVGFIVVAINALLCNIQYFYLQLQHKQKEVMCLHNNTGYVPQCSVMRTLTVSRRTVSMDFRLASTTLHPTVATCVSRTATLKGISLCRRSAATLSRCTNISAPRHAGRLFLSLGPDKLTANITTCLNYSTHKRRYTWRVSGERCRHFVCVLGFSIHV